MRPGARREHVGKLRDLSRIAADMAQRIEVAELPDLRRVSVGWGSDGHSEIDVGGTYIFQKGDERHIVEIIRALAWGLFESRRAGSDPHDPQALAEVRAILQDAGEAILGPRRPECPRCGGLQHICVTCELCPECSAWLAPQAPR